MATFTPGQFRQKLQEKIKANPDPTSPQVAPLQIKNTDPSTFARPASSYAASQMQQINQSVKAPTGTANLPQGSIMHQPVHERMKAFVTGQYGKK